MKLKQDSLTESKRKLSESQETAVYPGKTADIPSSDDECCVSSKQSFTTRTREFLNDVTVEPVVFINTMAFMLFVFISQSFTIRKFCLIPMNLTEEVCDNLTHNATLEKEAEMAASTFVMIKNFFDVVPTVLFVLFVGPWSDRVGRKTALCLPCAGGALGMIGLLISAYWMKEIPPEMLYVTTMPISFTGGLSGNLVPATSYITDVSRPERVTFRMAVMQVCFLAATPIGTILGGIIFEKFGYISVFTTSLVFYILGFLYAIFFIKETIQKPANSPNGCSTFFDISNLRDGFRTLVKLRSHNHRLHLILFMIIAVINTFPLIGELTIGYLYTRWKFQWTEATYSYYSTATLASMATGLLIAVPILTERFHLSETTVGVMSCITKIFTDILVAMSINEWMMFSSCIFAIFNGVVGSLTRSILSKFIDENERGKVFSLIGACEAVTPAIAGVLYVQVYNNSMQTLPGAPYLMSAGFYLIPLLLFGYLRYDLKNLVKPEDITLEDSRKPSRIIF